jgi:hypothetical protein
MPEDGAVPLPPAPPSPGRCWWRGAGLGARWGENGGGHRGVRRQGSEVERGGGELHAKAHGQPQSRQ